VAVVATAVGGTPEIIEDGLNGFLIEAGDAASMAQRISELLDSATKRSAMGEKGRQRLKEQFTFQAQAAAYFSLANELMHQGSRSGTNGPLHRCAHR
jgi:glycosyltransferase involved in cell wall biosynthesis